MSEKIIVASGKGGAGKSSLCAGLALSLASKGESVLVIDFDIGQSCVDFILGAQTSPVYNWGDALSGRCSPKEILSSEGSVFYISAPKRWEDSFTAEKMKKTVEAFEKTFDYILFDSPAGLTGGFLLAAECADSGIIVSTPDEVCVRAAANAADELFERGVDNVRLVINRFDRRPTEKGKFLNIDEVIDSVKVRLIGVVPEDKNITYCSSAGFKSLDECPAKAAYARIAGRLCGKEIPLVLSNSKKEKPKSKKPLVAVLVIIAVIIAVLGAAFLTDFYMASSLNEPVFCVQTDEGTYRGFCYEYTLEKDGGKIVSTQMKVFDKTVSAAIE